MSDVLKFSIQRVEAVCFFLLLDEGENLKDL